jgi:formate/nitrite transporter FocA (FNT family)
MSTSAEPLTIDSTRRNAHEIYEKAKENARDELDRSSHALAFSGVAGGFMLGLTALGVGTSRAILGPGPASEFISMLFYPIGFIAVIIGRFQLFTENTLYPVVLVLSERRHVLETLRLWAIVFLTNILGASIFALLVAYTRSVQPKTLDEIVKMGAGMVSAMPAEVFWSGVIGGWLIALVAWMVSASHWTIGQVVVIWLLCFVIGAGQFAHCIATSCEIMVAALRGSTSAGAYGRWLLFATLGNLTGGVTIVSIMNWGQVHAGESK